jgi:hypothetical protein
MPMPEKVRRLFLLQSLLNTMECKFELFVKLAIIQLYAREQYATCTFPTCNILRLYAFSHLNAGEGFPSRTNFNENNIYFPILCKIFRCYDNLRICICYINVDIKFTAHDAFLE